MRSLALIRNKQYQEVKNSDFESLVDVLLTKQPADMKQYYQRETLRLNKAI